MTTSDVYVIWDSLKIFNPQTVTAFSNGTSIFKTQIRYGYDNGTISGAYANMTTPTVMLGQVASNSSGWLTFSFSLTGISGPYTMFGVNDSAYMITISSLNQTFTFCSWSLNPHDQSSNALSFAEAEVTLNSVSVWSGPITATIDVPADTYNVTVTWLQGIIVSITLNVPVTGGTVTNITCLCYPYNVGSSTVWLASNATISSVTSASTAVTVNFAGPVGSYILVSSCPTKATVIYNIAYDYASNFTSGYLVLTRYANTSITLSYEDIGGGACVQRTDYPITSTSYVDLSQTFSLQLTGPSGSISLVQLYCGTRRCPMDSGGFTGSSYVPLVYTGYYAFDVVPKTLYVKWSSSGSSSSDQGGTVENPTIIALIDVTANLSGTMRPGQTLFGTFNITWSGNMLLVLTQVKLYQDYANWTLQVPVGFPVNLHANDPSLRGSSLINFFLHVPEWALVKNYTIPISARALRLELAEQKKLGRFFSLS